MDEQATKYNFTVTVVDAGFYWWVFAVEGDEDTLIGGKRQGWRVGGKHAEQMAWTHAAAVFDVWPTILDRERAAKVAA